MRFLSLGAGVQSTTVALMAAIGELDPIDAAIFADTGWEPSAVYRHLAWLESVLPFPVHRVSAGHRLQDRVANGKNYTGNKGFVDIPLHHIDQHGRAGMASRRQCTRAYKIRPVRRKIRELMHGHTAVQVMGISLDESHRMRDPDVQYLSFGYPLVEKRMTRENCLGWLRRHYPERDIPRSACVGCPFHTSAEWVLLSYEEPEQFASACEIDARVRSLGPEGGQGFLHKRRIPLAEAVKRDAREKELADSQLSLWDLECEGMCGI